MIIYNKKWLSNLIIQDQIAIAHNQGDINAEELKKIKEKYPVGFYSPNIFLRVGIFLLTLIILCFSMGLISLVAYDLKLLDSPYYYFFLGLINYTVLEYMVRVKHHYRSGADDALMWVAAGLFLTAYIFLMDQIFLSKPDHPAALFMYSFSFLLATYFALRFSDLLMAITAVLALAAFIFYAWLAIEFYAFDTLPFLMMSLSAVIYYTTKQLAASKKYPFYNNSITAVTIVSLLLFYLSGNFFIVRELGAEISNQPLQEAQPVPFAWFFWAWTFIIPVLYIGFGLKKKDVIQLRVGLVLIAAAAFTLKNYYDIMPSELLMLGAGTVLVAIAWSTIKYLKTPKKGFTSAEIDDGNALDSIQIESLIVGETFSGPQPGATGHQMGGGNFGGGGASGNF